MREFLIEHQYRFYFIITVIAVVLILRFITTKIINWTISKLKDKFPFTNFSSLPLIRNLLFTLYTLLGVILVSFVFIPSLHHENVRSVFYTTAYIGIVAVMTVFVASTTNILMRRKILHKDIAKEDTTSYKFLNYIVRVLIYIIGIILIILAFPDLRGFIKTILGGAGVLALIAGIASQEALSNFISGFLIISFKPFKIGDTVRLGNDVEGIVVDITLRHTVIRDFDNKMMVIPNAIINKEKLLNYDLYDHKCVERLEVGISYDSDIDKAKACMQDEAANHPLVLDIRSDSQKSDGVPMIKSAVTKLDNSSVVIRIWVWTRNFSDGYQTRCDLLESIKKRFDKEGIEIPFPYRTLVIKDSGATSEGNEEELSESNSSSAMEELVPNPKKNN